MNDSQEFEKPEVFDLESRDGFEKALRAKIPRAFLFGPVEFNGLNNSEAEDPFDFEMERENVTSIL